MNLLILKQIFLLIVVVVGIIIIIVWMVVLESMECIYYYYKIAQIMSNVCRWINWKCHCNHIIEHVKCITGIIWIFLPVIVCIP